MCGDELVVLGQCHSGLGEGDKKIESLEKVPRLCLSGIETCACEWVRERGCVSVHEGKYVCISITFTARRATTYPLISSLKTSSIDAT